MKTNPLYLSAPQGAGNKTTLMNRVAYITEEADIALKAACALEDRLGAYIAYDTLGATSDGATNKVPEPYYNTESEKALDGLLILTRETIRKLNFIQENMVL